MLASLRCSVDANTAVEQGGGIYSWQCSLYLTHSQVRDNVVSASPNHDWALGGGGVSAGVMEAPPGWVYPAVAIGPGVTIQGNDAMRGSAVLFHTEFLVGAAPPSGEVTPQLVAEVQGDDVLQGDIMWLNRRPTLVGSGSSGLDMRSMPVTLTSTATGLPAATDTNTALPAFAVRLLDWYDQPVQPLAGASVSVSVAAPTETVGAEVASFAQRGSEWEARFQGLSLLAKPGTTVRLLFKTFPSNDYLLTLEHDIAINLCPPGTSLAEDQRLCAACAPGTASPVANAALDACQPCTTGIVNDNSTACEACGVGTMPNSAATECDPCGALQVSSGLLCEPCAVGMQPSSNKSVCVPCPLGQVRKAEHATCVACASGFKALPNGKDCVRCPAGEVPSAVTAFTTCIACGNGTAPDAAFISCVNCAAGQYSSGRECLSCNDGLVPDPVTQAGSCMRCPAGMEPLGATCRVCDADHISDGTGCVRCGAGTVPSAVDRSRCVACPGGTTRPDSSTQCQLCPEGQYALADHKSCELCPKVGVKCTGGVLVVLPGFWRAPPPPQVAGAEGLEYSNSSDMITASTVFYECGEGACVVANGTVACVEDHSGPLCAVCAPDTFKLAADCIKCPSQGLGWMLSVALFLFTLVALAVTIVRATTLHERVPPPAVTAVATTKEQAPAPASDTMSYVKIFITYLQVHKGGVAGVVLLSLTVRVPLHRSCRS